ncbi:MAG: haloacid dehalogenase type II [Rhodobacteraceae bacterium]|nr:haloacid dehalogenase type II [Paracoccaceae bacterium]MCY4197888.1 haloacid dehalogenase type II [Paracoccaceae bacterium]
MRLTQHKILSFDCYGTLIDWETGIINGLSPLASRSNHPLSEDQILEAHAYHESSQQRATPGMVYTKLLAVVHRRLAEDWNVPTRWEESLSYGESAGDWPAFGDSADSLKSLSSRFKLAILSNVDNRTFARSVQKLGVSFDAVFTAEDIGSYKPSTGNFTYMLDHLRRRGFSHSDILHVAESLFHDHVPAKQAGLHNCWIHRRRGKAGFGAAASPAEIPETDFVFSSLRELAEACESEGSV